MKKQLFWISSFVVFLSISLVGCADEINDEPQQPTETRTPVSSEITEKPSPVATSTVSPLITLPTEKPSPTQTQTPTDEPFVLPSVTMSPAEAENALIELLQSNGNCLGKCVAGIYPDEMSFQEAAEVMTQWGPLSIGENSLGRTYIKMVQMPLFDQVSVNLSVGTWSEEFFSVDHVRLDIEGSTEFVIGDEIWLENYESWTGIRIDNLLNTYGTPSYVGFFFQTYVDEDVNNEGRNILYLMGWIYEETNIVVDYGALAFVDGDTIRMCPSIDPHDLRIDINPERPIQELFQFFPVEWEELTGFDIYEFETMFTDDPKTCFTTTYKQITELQDDFR